ncbi:MAG: hypothetical protein O2968_23785 [Acidobacteria bacterium]|nr:hypothetical protein [Acidobacteriota bacterium]
MKRLLLAVCVMALFSSLPLAAETVDGYLIDKMCSAKIVEKGGGAAKMHTKMCALMPDCKASGFGVVTADGKYLKFDSAGDEKAVKLLEGTDKKDSIKVSVDGKVDGSNITVKSLSLS